MRRAPVMATMAALLIPLLWLPAQAVNRAQRRGTLPPRLAEYVKSGVKLDADKESALLAGQPVTQLLETDPSSEVAVFGAVWIDAPMSRYVDAVKDIERFEQGGNFLVTSRIGSPPRLEDFDRLILPPDDVKGLRTCKVGDCVLKLGEPVLTRLRKEVDWSKADVTADVDRFMRRMALEYVTGYMQGGNKELAVYRDKDRPTFVAQEFATMIDRMPAITDYLPALKRYLLDYPAATLPNSESFLYWQKVKFGLKPTIRINHLTIVEEPEHVTVVSKMLYATHYFWTAIELRVLVPDSARGKGFWYVTVNQSRSDGLTGFKGSIIRRKVRGETESGMQSALATLKSRLEGS